MFCKRIIPCLDVKDGRVVKGTNFIELRDAGDPVELAKHYSQQGADELVFLDITASSDNRKKLLLDLIEKVAEEVFIPFTVGGGVSDVETISDLLKAGADKVSVNTAAISNPAFVKEATEHFGSQCIVAAIDTKAIHQDLGHFPQYLDTKLACNRLSRWQIYTHGGRKATGIDAIAWANYMCELGVGELLITSMDRDGTKDGYDISFLKEIRSKVKVPMIASGGAGTHQHIIDALNIVDAALLASLLHFQHTSIDNIKQDCVQNNLPMRLR